MSLFSSRQFSFIILRFGLAAVFIWFGIDKINHPDYWLNAWLPSWLAVFLTGTQITVHQFIYSLGFFEILAGFCLLTGILLRPISFVATFFLIVSSLAADFNEITVKNLGLIGGLLSILFWPKRNGRF